MSGYRDLLWNDLCNEKQDDIRNLNQFEYVTDINRYMSPSVNTCSSQRYAGGPCDVYGPFNQKVVLRDSFLNRGYGNVSSDCVECQEKIIPKGVFDDEEPYGEYIPCQDVSMLPEDTRLPKSCNYLSEKDSLAYQLVPQQFSEGYLGYNALNDCNVNSRELARKQWYEQYAREMEEDIAENCGRKTSYAQFQTQMWP